VARAFAAPQPRTRFMAGVPSAFGALGTLREGVRTAAPSRSAAEARVPVLVAAALHQSRWHSSARGRRAGPCWFCAAHFAQALAAALHRPRVALLLAWLGRSSRISSPGRLSELPPRSTTRSRPASRGELGLSAAGPGRPPKYLASATAL
jgi:hypothetical protein